MRKSIPISKSSPHIFSQLKKENLISAKKYDQLLDIMRNLGYSDFLTREQGLITLKYLNGENVFGVMPTSGGKSFTFQTVSRMTDGLTIVVSPLISLMKDQVSKYNDAKVMYINSDLPPSRKKQVINEIREGKLHLLYLSPERLKSADFKALLHSSPQLVKRIVIDEAHCVVEWGHSFRVKYLHIAQEIDNFEKQLGQKIPVLLLTATASPWLQRETVKNLQISMPSSNFIIQKMGADRPELVVSLHSVKNDTDKILWLAKQLKRGGKFYGKRGIIFSAFADGGEGLGALNAEQICEKLKDMGIKRIDFYHGKLGLDLRRKVQKMFQNYKLNILVATKAFGMGIDLPKLNFIIHFYPPLSLEEYWQEIGRGGRNMQPGKGEYCQCIVLHKPSDKKILEVFPSQASFEKILSTYTCATQNELCFGVKNIRPNGRLRKLLIRLHEINDIRRLKKIKVGKVFLERWKIIKSAKMLIKHIELEFAQNNNYKTDQTKRLRSNLRIRANRAGKVLRVEQGSWLSWPLLDYYNTELNWFTDPEIKALEMIDDKKTGNKVYTRFRILKKQLSLQDKKLLASKINLYRSKGYAKLDFVFDHFLKAKNTKAKELIIEYLSSKKRPS